jgi:cytochrome c-type biogenesis protein CcmH/NrfG
MLAVCYEDVERYEDAKEAYTKSYQIDPDLVKQRDVLARLANSVDWQTGN